ncbi:MAG: hypothetical protein ACTSQ8_24900 [Candidatus Helarchaeota archaeon]
MKKLHFDKLSTGLKNCISTKLDTYRAMGSDLNILHEVEINLNAKHHK